MLVALLFACESGTVVLTDPADDAAADTGLAGDDTGEEQEEEVSWEGEYDVVFALIVPIWSWDMCDGDATVEVDADGNFEFESDCYGYEDGWDWDTPIWGDGVIQDDGEVYGTMSFEWWSREESVDYEGELWGSISDDDGFELDYLVEDVSFGRGEEEDVEGWIVSE